MGIKKHQLDLNFAIALQERDNPGQRRAQQGSNRVMLVSMAVVAVALLVLLRQKNVLSRHEKNIKDHEEYMSNERNVAMFAYKQEVQAAINDIKAYNLASKTFLEQLENSARFEMSMIKEYEDLFKANVSQQTRLTHFEYDMQTLTLKFETDNRLKMFEFISALREMKDEDETLLYPRVFNNSVVSIGDDDLNPEFYEYVIELDVWATEEIPEEAEAKPKTTTTTSAPGVTQ